MGLERELEGNSVAANDFYSERESPRTHAESVDMVELTRAAVAWSGESDMTSADIIEQYKERLEACDADDEEPLSPQMFCERLFGA